MTWGPVLLSSSTHFSSQDADVSFNTFLVTTGTLSEVNKMLSYCTETALQGAL